MIGREPGTRAIEVSGNRTVVVSGSVGLYGRVAGRVATWVGIGFGWSWFWAWMRFGLLASVLVRASGGCLGAERR